MIYVVFSNRYIENKIYNNKGVNSFLKLDLWGINFHAVVVFGLVKNLLFKSALGHCV